MSVTRDLAHMPKDWFQAVAEGAIPGYSVIEKFGANPDVDTGTDPEDLWGYGGTYNFSSSADIDEISSSHNSDTFDVYITGLDTNWDLVTQTITLTGQTPKALDTQLIRVNCMRNASGTAAQGDIYLTAGDTHTLGVPDTPAKVRAKMLLGKEECLQAVFSVPNKCTAYFWGGYVSLASGPLKNENALFSWRARPFGGVLAVKSELSCQGAGRSSWDYTYKIPVALPAKADVLIRCEEVSADNMAVSGGFTILLKEDGY